MKYLKNTVLRLLGFEIINLFLFLEYLLHMGKEIIYQFFAAWEKIYCFIHCGLLTEFLKLKNKFSVFYLVFLFCRVLCCESQKKRKNIW